MVAINITAITILSAVIHCARVSCTGVFLNVSVLCLENLKMGVCILMSMGLSFIG